MRHLKISALVLATGLLLISCGGEAQENETPQDTTVEVATPPAMEEAPAVPDSVNGIDTTVNLDKSNKGISAGSVKVGGN